MNIVFSFALLCVLAFKPTTALLAGWSLLNEKNSVVDDLANWSLSHLDRINGESPVLVYISNIYYQLVAGVNYNFTVGIDYNVAKITVNCLN